MIRFVTDINVDARGVFNRQITREKTTMKAFAVSLSLAFAAWMSSALMLAYYSREVAEFIVEHLQ